MNRRIYLLLACLFAASTLAGCGSVDEPVVDAAPAPLSGPVPADKPEVAAANPPNTPTSASPPTPIQPVVQFTPAFPDRLELFEPLQRAQGTVRRDDQGETVELKGFINVHEPKVLLAIDGVIAPIPQGGEKYGVQVISIEPPSVVLQRGRNRWKATLE